MNFMIIWKPAFQDLSSDLWIKYGLNKNSDVNCLIGLTKYDVEDMICCDHYLIKDNQFFFQLRTIDQICPYSPLY